ncbi:hypothetical protein QE152_g26945 [Popillia japonica]|uniref:Uncharacterized protein n=1 Tax=Popillia japonica TaxID=7064 RepID=A0AAW1JWK4_POPJA
MYRQVVMHPSYTPFQRILWRENKEEAIKTYELTTVTYGTVPASFLAVRALQQLGRDESQNFPIGYEIILRDFYVDDLLTGANTIAEGNAEGNQIVDEVYIIATTTIHK